MSVFRPHIAISPTYANLELPVGFKPDDTEILVKATPDQRAVVINTGCVVLRALLEKKDELSEDQAFKKGKEEGIAAELKKWQREKTTLEAEERDRLNKELNDAKDLSEKYLSDCREAEKKQNQLSEEKFSEISKAEEKVTQEWSKKYEELNEKYMQRINRQANSSTKGKDNEDDFADLLVASFGTANVFKILEKQIESGDHIIQWDELKLMFENKIYATTIPKAQVEKAQRDFKNRDECDVLIVVSQDTDIADHQHAGGLDITHTLDGRPEIWIGKFGLIEDKIRYLQLLGVVIRQLVRLQKREKQLENSKDSVDQKKKIEDIRQYFQDTWTDLNEIDTAHNKYQRAQNAARKSLKNQIKVTIDNFQERLKYAMKDGNDFEEDDVIEIEEVESDAASKTPASSSKKTRKTHATPSKAKKARNSEIPETGNSIRNFLNKIPGSASENQAGQDALSGPTPN